MALPFLRQAWQQRKIGRRTLSLRSPTGHILPLLALVLFGSCDPTKRVAEGDYLLKENRILLSGEGVDPDELAAIVKQKSNKRILGVPFYLGLYNLRDPQTVLLKRLRHDSLCAQRNVERLAKGKREKHCDRSSRPRTGEPPVLLDTNLTARTTEQFRLYLQKEGFFKAVVQDSVHHNHRKWFGTGRGRRYSQPKVEVEYTVIPGPEYRYRHISFIVDDPTIEVYIKETWDQCLLKTGARFDSDVLDAERLRITARLRELGYLFFTRDLVVYDADTAVGDHQVDIILRAERPYANTDRGLKDTREGTIYTVKDVTILTQRNDRGVPLDTTEFQGYSILYQDALAYRPKSLLSSVFLRPNERYQQSNSDNTYRRLTGLRVFDRVELTYDTSGTGRPGLVNAEIALLPSKEQSMSLEGYMTNRGGFLGTTISVGYRHRNLLRTLGYIQGQMNLGLEAQQSFTGTSTASNQPLIGQNSFFNTIAIGPEVTIGFPRPFTRFFKQSSGSRLLFNTLYNYQRRPDFIRTLARASLGMEWNETRTKSIGLYPVDLSVIKIPSTSPEFDEFLQGSNDPVYKNSYTDHMIIGGRSNFTWNTQGVVRSRTVRYYKATVETSGNLLRGLHKLSSKPTETDTTGHEYYTVAGIRYAQFVKLDNDFRVNHTIHDRSSMAFRVAAGIGIPLANLNVLPFETSFFGGGANGMRAWRARSLGPGSYSAPLFAYDRIGEIRIEGNAEYRFKLIGYLEGALFADVGNIWIRNKDPNRPGAEFEVGDFISELGVGTGVGARLNFDFFIVRFDLGLQTKDPSLPRGERWLFQPKDKYEAQLQELTGAPVDYKAVFNFNLGIGYPF